MENECDGPCSKTLELYAKHEAAIAVSSNNIEQLEKAVNKICDRLEKGAKLFEQATIESVKQSMEIQAQYDSLTNRLHQGTEQFVNIKAEYREQATLLSNQIDDIEKDLKSHSDLNDKKSPHSEIKRNRLFQNIISLVVLCLAFGLLSHIDAIDNTRISIGPVSTTIKDE